jgi:hypothetical protein
LLSVAVTTDVGAYHGSRDRTTRCGEIPATPVTNLVTENATNDCTDDGAGHTRVVSILNHLFALDPASLLGWSYYRSCAHNVRLKQALVIAPAEILVNYRSRRIATVIDVRVAAQCPHR